MVGCAALGRETLIHAEVAVAKTLQEIFDAAGRAYPDGFLQRQLERHDAAADDLSITESLANYIVKELKELYHSSSSDEANLNRISSSLERSAHLLEKVAAELRGLNQ